MKILIGKATVKLVIVVIKLIMHSNEII